MAEGLKNIERKVVRTGLAVGMAAAFWGLSTPNANASGVGGCKGSECTGRSPVGLCDGDAKTVASIAVIPEHMRAYAGQLDLRYSPSCKANWGRFTAAQNRSLVFSLFKKDTMFPFGRVTVWNPGEPSQDAVDGTLNSGLAGTSYTAMVDGTRAACTGVEIYYSSVDEPPTEDDSVGWTWGPCR